MLLLAVWAKEPILDVRPNLLSAIRISSGEFLTARLPLSDLFSAIGTPIFFGLSAHDSSDFCFPPCKNPLAVAQQVLWFDRFDEKTQTSANATVVPANDAWMMTHRTIFNAPPRPLYNKLVKACFDNEVESMKKRYADSYPSRGRDIR